MSKQVSTRKLLIMMAAGISFAGQSAVAATQIAPYYPSTTQVAAALKWQPYLDCASHLCDGYYLFDPALTAVPNPPPMDKAATDIRAAGQSQLQADGRSILHKDVVITQKGRRIKADKAYIYRNNNTGKITRAELFGHVSDETADNLIVCPYADINFSKQHGYFKHAITRHRYPSKKDGEVTSWGTATDVHHWANGDTDLSHHMRLSLCSPKKPTWIIHGLHGHIYKHKQRLKVYDAYITFHHIPLIFTPYLSISLNKARKSGFLMPKFGYHSKSGFQFGLPYYFNIAPNYDDKFTPGFYTKRGMYVLNTFRWLESFMQGKFQLEWLPHDRAFAGFIRDQLKQISPTTQKSYYDALNRASLDRYNLYLENSVNFNKRWSSKILLQHVSDDYFLEDLGDLKNTDLVLPNQLLNTGSISYTGSRQQFSLSALGYQTLHPLGNGATNQYQSFGANYHFNLPLQRVLFDWQSSITDFLMPNNAFTPPLKPIEKVIDGTRYHARALMVYPWVMSAGYVKAELGWDMLSDALFYEQPVQSTNTPPTGVQPKHVARALPIINIDSSIYLENHHLFHTKRFNSTIQPELSYLYVPYKDQSTLPIFDTTLLPLSYDTLFSTNRFLGVDRMQNANQFNMGVKTTLTKKADGTQVLLFGVGTQYYMTLPKVGAHYQDSTTPLSQRHFSPLVSELTWTPISSWTTTVDWNWDMYHHQTTSATLNISYSPSTRVHFMGAYSYVGPSILQADTPAGTPGSAASFASDNIYTLGVASPIGRHLEAFSYQYFDGTNEHMLANLEGFQYDSCCWALRFGYSHRWQRRDPNTQKDIYGNGVYVQFILKGLGDFGTNLSSLLKTDFSGYNYR